MEVFRKIKYFMAANVLIRTWIWIWRTYFRVQFHKSKFLMVQLTLYVWFRQWLSNRLVTSHYLNWWWQYFCHYMYGVTRPQWVNSSWPSDAKWQHGSGSTLAQVMDHFLMAPSHYLNQCSLITSEVLWPSTEGNRVSQEILKISILDINLRINTFKITAPSPICQWFKVCLACRSREAVQSWRLENLCCEHTIWAQCATFPIDRGPDLGKNWVGQGKLSNLVAQRSTVISCVLLYDSISGLYVYTVGLWWIILALDRWSMTSANTISHTVSHFNNLSLWYLVVTC